MKIDDRTRFVISAMAVGISAIGAVSSVVLLLVSFPTRSQAMRPISLAIIIASFILFECSGVAKKRLKERWSSNTYSVSRKAKLLRVLAGTFVFLILVVIVAFQTPKPWLLFSIALGCWVAGGIIALLIVWKMGYL